MASIKELRLRLRSLRNTIKITSAMKLVSASKLRRAKEASTQSKPFMENLSALLNRVLEGQENISNPLFENREIKKIRYIVVTSDRGLCGGFNNNLLKYFLQIAESEKALVEVEVVGKKAKDYLSKRITSPIHVYDMQSSAPKYDGAQSVAMRSTKAFLNKEVDKVVVVYNQFISTLTQKPTTVTLLPIQQSEKKSSTKSGDYIFEPNPSELLGTLLPRQISMQLFQGLLDNAAGEHAARMTAMENATNNARDLISQLTIKMNRARQAAITTELTEIVSGAESLKN